MSDTNRPIAIKAEDAELGGLPANYPADLAKRMADRVKRRLGDMFGLTVFGVNLTRLRPGAWSLSHHQHTRQDEFIYVLEGQAVLITDAGETQLSPGMCAGFPAGGTAHHLENRGTDDVVILEVGDRGAGETVSFPNDDIRGAMRPEGGWHFTRMDGTPISA